MNDYLQTGSLVVVSLALIANVVQTFLSRKHSLNFQRSMRGAILTNAMQSHTDHRTTFFLNDPALLEWHLLARGYNSSDYESNKKRLYTLVKLDEIESKYLIFLDGSIDRATWDIWDAVLTEDVRSGFMPDVWENGRRFYHLEFQKLVDEKLSSVQRVPTV